jgi:hypothetical protein
VTKLLLVAGNALDKLGSRASGVVSLGQRAELQQARYFKVLLAEQRADVEDQIAGTRVALAKHQVSGDKRASQNLRQLIGAQRREEFELDCLIDAIQQRFFPKAQATTTPPSCFDVEIRYTAGWWQIRVPEIGGMTKVRRREHAEMTAREYIAVSIGRPIREVAVRLIGDA